MKRLKSLVSGDTAIRAAAVLALGAAVVWVKGVGVGGIPTTPGGVFAAVSVEVKAALAVLAAAAVVAKIGPRRVAGSIPSTWPARAAIGLVGVAGVVWFTGFSPLSLLPDIDPAAIVIGFVTDIRVVATGVFVAVVYVVLVRDGGPSVSSIVDRGGVGIQAAAVFVLSYVATTLALGGSVV